MIRDSARRLLEALGGVCWWQGDATMRGYYEEAVAIWEGIGDDRELANAYYNASFSYALGPDGTFGAGDPDGEGEGYVESALEAFRRIGDARGEANALWGLGDDALLPGRFHDQRAGEPPALELFGASGDRTMESWARHMLGLALIAQLRTTRREIPGRPRGPALPPRPAMSPGLADALRPVLGRRPGGRPRAGGPAPRGAHNLSNETGTTLGVFTEDAFEPPGCDRTSCGQMSVADVERLGAEGAAMTLDEVIAYALEGAPEEFRGVIFDAATRPQPILILDGDDDETAAAAAPTTSTRRPSC